MNLSSAFSKKEINDAQLVLHHASQLVAIAGKYLLPEQDDDSHTNMGWDQESDTFLSHLINNRARVGLHVPALALKVLGPSNLELASLPLSGKTRKEALVWLKQALQLKQIDTESIKPDLHYEIPEHEIDHGKPFPAIDVELLKELVLHRTLAHQVCKSVSVEHEYASEPRTWPHHFDLGTYVPFKHDPEGNVMQSFSVGYAVADSIKDEPYFYVTQWKKDQDIDYSTVPELTHGEWLPEELKGAALRFSLLSSAAKNTQSRITVFIDATVKWSVNI